MNLYADGDPVGACEAHRIVLRKSGDIVTCAPDNPLWRRALETTSP